MLKCFLSGSLFFVAYTCHRNSVVVRVLLILAIVFNLLIALKKCTETYIMVCIQMICAQIGTAVLNLF